MAERAPDSVAGPSVHAVRAAVVAELPLLRAVELAADTLFPEMVFPPGSVLDALDATHTVLVIGAVPVGFIVTGTLGDHLHVHQLSVRPDHGRRGFGTALLSAAVDDAPVPVTLTTFGRVPWNAPWYMARGFERFDSAEWGPELRELVAEERAAGLDDLGPRLVLRKLPERGHDG